MRVFLHSQALTDGSYSHWMTDSISVDYDPPHWRIRCADGSEQDVIGKFIEVSDLYKALAEVHGKGSMVRVYRSVKASDDDAEACLEPVSMSGEGAVLVEITEDERTMWTQILADHVSLMQTWSEMFDLAWDGIISEVEDEPKH